MTTPPQIGVDLGGTKIEVIALGPGDQELPRRRIPAPRGSYDDTLRAIRGLVDGAEATLGQRLPRVGIGTPGALSPHTGLQKNSNSEWLNGKPLDRDLRVALGREIRLANDADCFALSEATTGAARGARTVFGVILGTGVGGGVVVDGRIVAGPNAIAGEWGHNPLPSPRDDERPGPACYCGRSGCIEAFLAGPAVERGYATRFGRQESFAAIAARADVDVDAAAILELYADRLARSLAGVINILDPHAIVLGGGVSNVGRLYEAVPRLWGRWVFSDQVATRLVRAQHGDSSGVLGAAKLFAADVTAPDLR